MLIRYNLDTFLTGLKCTESTISFAWHNSLDVLVPYDAASGRRAMETSHMIHQAYLAADAAVHVRAGHAVPRLFSLASHGLPSLPEKSGQ